MVMCALMVDISAGAVLIFFCACMIMALSSLVLSC